MQDEKLGTNESVTESFQSTEEVPDPHAFRVILVLTSHEGVAEEHRVEFAEPPYDQQRTEGMAAESVDNEKHDVEKVLGVNVGWLGEWGSQKSTKAKYDRDNNFRAALLHVIGDMAVSLLVIFALVLASVSKSLHFLDPTVAILGSLVIIYWAFTLTMDSAANLLDMNPDMKLTQHLQQTLESDGSVVTDLHVWRLGPGHLGAIITVVPPVARRFQVDESYYHGRLLGFRALSHVTIEVCKTNTQMV